MSGRRWYGEGARGKRKRRRQLRKATKEGVTVSVLPRRRKGPR